MPRHGVCGRSWSGSRACHCSGCHRTFSGTELFDRHRNHRGDHGSCLDPATLPRMELWSDGIWHMPAMTPLNRAKVARRR
jgi:hypothetical protein